MIPKFLLTAALLAFASPVLAADGVTIVDPYARVMGANAKTGAAFMVIENHADADDRLIGAASDVAERVELHTHKADANGTMRMMEVPEGFPVPAHGDHALARGGDHVMLLGLKRPLAQGDTFTVTLTFERSGEVTVEVPVDLERKADHGAMGGQMPGGQMPGQKHSH